MKRVSLFLLFIAVNCLVNAQGFYNNGAIVSIAPSTILVLPDSLVNTGTLINDGDLRISGAWINQGTYEAGTGQIDFNSDLPQTINHHDQSVGILTISGGGEKEFLANITVQSGLNLESGILASKNGAKLIMDQTVVISGGSNSSHIKGAVERQGTGNWLFPVGNGTDYLPVEIADVTDPDAKATLTLNELTQGNSLKGESDLVNLSEKRYWQLVLTAGKLDQSNISLPLAGEGMLTDHSNLVVIAGSSAAEGPYKNLGQTQFTGTTSSGSVTGNIDPNSVFYTVAATSGETAIEVFNAVSANGDEKNVFMRIRNIELYPDNTVIIFSRWGDRVFELQGYDNDQKNFKGESNISGTKLPAGTYFYSIDLNDGSAKKTGFVEVR